MPHTANDLMSRFNLSRQSLQEVFEIVEWEPDYTCSEEEVQDKFQPAMEALKQYPDKEKAKEYFATQVIASSAKSRLHKPNTEPGKGRKSAKNVASNPSLNPNTIANQESHNKKENDTTSSAEEEFSISEVIKQVNQLLGVILTFKQISTVFALSGLADKDCYSQKEFNRFLSVCITVLGSENVDLSIAIENNVTSLESGLLRLVDEVTRARAKEVPDALKQMYLQNVVIALTEQQEDMESFFLQIKDSIIDNTEGKSRLRLIMERQWMPPLLSESTPKPYPSPPISENGTSSNLTPDTRQ